jgi:uncharacterized membrane protein
MKVLGFALVLLGVLTLAFAGFHDTGREKIIDVAPIAATASTRDVPPLAGGLALATGLALVFASRRSTVP